MQTYKSEPIRRNVLIILYYCRLLHYKSIGNMWKKETFLVAFVLLLSYLNPSEAACGEGTLGQVQNTYYTRNSSIYITWKPPTGWEDCYNLTYEIQWKDSESGVTFFTDTTAETQYTFHYAAANFFCQIFGVSLFAKYNDAAGGSYDTVIVGDNFTSVIVDPVQDLQVQQLGNYMLVRWDPPTKFKACWALYYQLEVLHLDTVITTWQEQRTFFSFNYEAEQLCDTQLLVRVTARFRNLDTAAITRLFLTGPC